MKDKQRKQATVKDDEMSTLANTRRFFRKKMYKKQDETNPKDEKWVQIRLLPIWLRIIIVLVLTVLVAIIGAFIGYSIVGDGVALELFKKETWTHITDIIQGVE